MTILYYIVRIVQRGVLLGLVLATFIHWAIYVSAVAIEAFQSAAQVKYQHPLQAATLLNNAINLSRHSIYVWLAAAVAATIGMVLFRRVRQVEIRLLVDSIAVILFCLGATLFTDWLVRDFVGHLR